MIIDIGFLLIMVFAVITGWRKGLILAVFSIVGFIAGLAAALKLSSFVADKLSATTNSDGKWLPVISFILVFVAVALLVNLGAKLIQRTFEMVMLGWLNRAGGILLYILLYSIIFSIFLFYASMLRLISPATIAASQVYPYIEPLGPRVINSLGTVIPWFRDMFSQLESFFGRLPAEVNKPGT